MTRIRLTVADLEAYCAIKAYIEREGCAPTLLEIGRLLDRSSSSTVYCRVRRLQALGLIAFKPNRARTLRIIGCPVMPNGEVA